MIIKPVSQAEMVERARQNWNKRHPFSQISAPNTEEAANITKKVKNQFLWEDVIPRVMRKIKWKKLV